MYCYYYYFDTGSWYVFRLALDFWVQVILLQPPELLALAGMDHCTRLAS